MLLRSPPLAVARGAGAAGGSTTSSSASRGRCVPIRPPRSTGATGSSRTASRSCSRRATCGGWPGLPGVRHVYGNVTYRRARGPRRGDDPRRASCPGRADSRTAARGIKIGIIDDGDRPDAPVLLSRPATRCRAGFPKGQTRVHDREGDRRARVPAGRRRRGSTRSSRSTPSSRATARTSPGSPPATRHDARRGRSASRASRPRAYLGNYKALTIPTDADVGLDGNAPEIVAAIEAAVADGMDVINLSLGEPEIEPSRDIVVARARRRRRAPASSRSSRPGNDFDEFGRGSVGSPGQLRSAITVGGRRRRPAAAPATSSPSSRRRADAALAAAQAGRRARPALDPLVRPDGVGDARRGRAWRRRTSSGAAALLLERHPTWTPAQVKAALSADRRAPSTRRRADASPTRGGGGLVDVARRTSRSSSPRPRRGLVRA